MRIFIFVSSVTDKSYYNAASSVCLFEAPRSLSNYKADFDEAARFGISMSQQIKIEQKETPKPPQNTHIPFWAKNYRKHCYRNSNMCGNDSANVSEIWQQLWEGHTRGGGANMVMIRRVVCPWKA